MEDKNNREFLFIILLVDIFLILFAIAVTNDIHSGSLKTHAINHEVYEFQGIKYLIEFMGEEKK